MSAVNPPPADVVATQPLLDPKTSDPTEYAEAWYQYYRAKWFENWRAISKLADIDGNERFSSQVDRLEGPMHRATLFEELAGYAQRAADDPKHGWGSLTITLARSFSGDPQNSSSPINNFRTASRNAAVVEFVETHKPMLDPKLFWENLS